MVLFMAKQELAQLAEALVNITSLKRKFSAEEETVAGPIDVAVISRSDGFVWVKRKHYFPADLNPQFFVRKFGIPTQAKEVAMLRRRGNVSPRETREVLELDVDELPRFDDELTPQEAMARAREEIERKIDLSFGKDLAKGRLNSK